MYGQGDSALQQLFKTDRNPIQETEYQRLLQQSGVTEGELGAGRNGADASALNPYGGLIQGNQMLAQAQKLLDFQKKANQPVVAQLESSKGDLESKYKDLVASIKGAGQVAGDKQTLATSNELGRRGITNDSGIYQQEQANASLPVQTAIASQLANTGMAQSGDLRNLALQIAQLQAGQPADALSGAMNFQGQQNQMQQFQQNLGMQQQQQQSDNDYRDRALAAQSQGGGDSRYTTLSEGQTLFDLLNGGPVYTAGKTYKPSGGGGASTIDFNTLLNAYMGK